MLNCYPLGFYHPSTLVKDAERHGVVMAPIDVTRSDWRCTLERIERPDDASGVLTSPYPRRGRPEHRERRERSDFDNLNRESARNLSPTLSLDKERETKNDPSSAASSMPSPPAEGAGQRERAHALRLGLKYVAGLRAETGARIERERKLRPFASIADFTARAAPNRRELDALAYAGAFAAFGMGRRAALWQAAAVERDPRGLFAGVEPAAGTVPLTAMDAMSETRADYAATGLTIGPHLMAHMREKLRADGVLAAAKLAEASHGAWVKTAGVVIVRQRPGTAKGFFFLTLEDETGIANAIVIPDLFQANRALLHNAGILLVEGVLQKQDGVVAIRARRFKELRLGAALPPSHDFR
jgi:error-prone DNA polymerase